MNAEKLAIQSRARIHLRAFTLVEVTMALGVVSFALLSLLGLVPMGLMAVHESTQQTACSHIIQKVGSDLAMTQQDAVSAYIAQPQYFDFDGSPVNQGSANAVFVAAFDAGKLLYPGSNNLSGMNDYTRVVVEIGRAQGGAAAGVIFRTAISLADSKR